MSSAHMACPKCGFSYAWDGRQCSHCHFIATVPATLAVSEQGKTLIAALISQARVTDSMIRFLCPNCGKRLKSPPGNGGRTGRCTSCGQKLVIPEGTQRIAAQDEITSKKKSIEGLEDVIKKTLPNNPVCDVLQITIEATSDGSVTVGAISARGSATRQQVKKANNAAYGAGCLLTIAFFILLIAGAPPNIAAGLVIFCYGLFGFVSGKIALSVLAHSHIYINWKAKVIGIIIMVVGIVFCVSH